MKWSSKWFRGLTLLSLGWLFFQFYIIFYPQIPLIQKPVHVAFALAFCFWAFPFSKGSLGKKVETPGLGLCHPLLPHGSLFCPRFRPDPQSDDLHR